MDGPVHDVEKKEHPDRQLSFTQREASAAAAAAFASSASGSAGGSGVGSGAGVGVGMGDSGSASADTPSADGHVDEEAVAVGLPVGADGEFKDNPLYRAMQSHGVAGSVPPPPPPGGRAVPPPSRLGRNARAMASDADPAMATGALKFFRAGAKPPKRG